MKLTRSLFLILLLLPSISRACSVQSSSDEVKFIAADHVLLVRIVSAMLLKTGKIGSEQDTGMVEARYEVVETFKGSAEPSYAREKVHGNGNCTMGFSVGHLYLLYLNGPDRYVGGGSHMVFLSDDELNSELEELRRLAANGNRN